jgi:hypothetical protein
MGKPLTYVPDQPTHRPIGWACMCNWQNHRGEPIHLCQQLWTIMLSFEKDNWWLCKIRDSEMDKWQFCWIMHDKKDRLLMSKINSMKIFFNLETWNVTLSALKTVYVVVVLRIQNKLEAAMWLGACLALCGMPHWCMDRACWGYLASCASISQCGQNRESAQLAFVSTATLLNTKKRLHYSSTPDTHSAHHFSSTPWETQLKFNWDWRNDKTQNPLHSSTKHNPHFHNQSPIQFEKAWVSAESKLRSSGIISVCLSSQIPGATNKFAVRLFSALHISANGKGSTLNLALQKLNVWSPDSKHIVLHPISFYFGVGEFLKSVEHAIQT